MGTPEAAAHARAARTRKVAEKRARFLREASEAGDECYEWDMARLPKGHGVIGLDGANYLAHRWAYEELVGPIPEGMYVIHSCDNPPCINPNHLRVGSAQDNTDDMVDRGRGYWAGRTECKNGHPYVLGSFVWARKKKPNGEIYHYRRCNECRKEKGDWGTRKKG